MDIQVALSAEEFDPRLPAHVSAVGMLRSEYVCRRLQRHLPDPVCQDGLSQYLVSVLNAFPDRPVWYRFFDAPSHEVNMLRGCDAYIVEDNPLMGIRGMRRALRFRKTFELEFSIVAELAADHPNLNVMFPYISEIEELSYGAAVAESIGFSNRMSAMIETPSAIYLAPEFRALGLAHFIVGMNDLSSLFLGAGRGAGHDRHDHPAVVAALRGLRESLHDCDLAVAGYIKPEFAPVAHDIGFDHIVVHYSSLPSFLGEAVHDFRELDFMANFKTNDNKKRLLRWSSDLHRLAEMEGTSGLQGANALIEESTWLASDGISEAASPAE